MESRLAARPLAYGRPGDTARFRPSGGLALGGKHAGTGHLSFPAQGAVRALLYGGDSGKVAVLALDTEAGEAQLSEVQVTGHFISGCAAEGSTAVCTGPQAPRLWSVSGDGPGWVDLQRGGYQDPVFLPATGDVEAPRLGVLDRVHSAWLVLGQDGQEHQRVPLGDGAYRAVPVQGDALAVAAGVAPRLAVYPLTGDGTVQVLSQNLPVRDMVYDAERSMLWTVGPAPETPTRRTGPIRGLYSVLMGYALDGASAPRRVDLRPHGVIDGTGLSLFHGEVVVVGTGSQNAVLYSPEDGQARVITTGHGPGRPFVVDDQLLIPNRFEESLTWVRDREGALQVSQVPLGESPSPPLREDLTALGELLYYEKHLWAEDRENRFTCNSCHWDLGSDHRMQPGYFESRFELTRPLRGIGMVAPIFTPMQSPTLADAVEGLFTALDERHYRRESLATEVRLVLPDGPLRLSPERARAALLTFLMDAKPRWGPSRQADGSFSQEALAGARLFQRDCARCHEPTGNMRTRERESRGQVEDWLGRLRQRPLSFGAPLFMKTGPEPYFTVVGNRVSPLFDLARSGPFFSNGRGRSLVELVASVQPKGPVVHPAAPAGEGAYNQAELRQLLAFLRSL